MKRVLRAFRDEDAGAVTVDWVVLTAGIVTAIVLVFNAVRDDTSDLAAGIGSYMASR